MKNLTTNKDTAKRSVQTNLYTVDRKWRQRAGEQQLGSVLRRETEPLLKPTGFLHSIIMYLLFNFTKFLGFFTIFFDISMREFCSLFLLQCSHYKLNCDLFYIEQVLSCLWRTLLQFICAVYLHLILSLTSDTNQSWLQVKSFRIGSNHNNQSRSKPAYNEIHCLGLNIELTCV